MNYQQYAHINQQISSEMFYSLMAILHERLPCSPNFYKLKKQFRQKQEAELGLDKSTSPVRTIASPKIMRGLSITKG